MPSPPPRKLWPARQVFAALPLLTVLLNGGCHPPAATPPPTPELLPAPREVAWQQRSVDLSGAALGQVAIVVDPTLSAHVRQGAAALAGDLVATGEGATNSPPRLVPDGSPAPRTARVVIRIVPAARAGGDEQAVPAKPEGFLIQFHRSWRRDEIIVAGRDDAGAYWGIMTLRQMLGGAPGERHAAAATIADWPDATRRSVPMSHRVQDDQLDQLTQLGRVNACFTEPLAMNWQTRQVTEVPVDEQRRLHARLHARGIEIAACSGWYHQWTRQREGRPFCPTQDTPDMLAMFERALDAGADGLDWHFDDLTADEARHHLDCPHCKGRFPTMVSWQVYCLQQLLAMGERRGVKLFMAVPTLYYTHKNGIGVYEKAGVDVAGYYRAFYSFPGAEKFRFYHCEFRPAQLAQLKAMGLRNYIWWNNGCWGADGAEVWGQALALPRMAYSWDVYDRTAIAQRLDENIDQDAYRSLARLKDDTDWMYTGAGGIGAVLGSIHAWNNADYIAREPAIRDTLFDRWLGPGMRVPVRTWEAHARPLWVKYQRLESFTPADREALASMRSALDAIRATATPASLLENYPRKMADVFDALTAYADLIQPLSGADPAAPALAARHGADMPFALAPAAALPPAWSALTPLAGFATNGPPMRQAILNGQPAVLLRDNTLRANDAALTLSRSSFTLELTITPTRIAPDQYYLFAGTRHTFREIYPGHPGWALGFDGLPTRAVRFTVEDAARHVDTVAATNALKANALTHLAVVRDWKQRRLTLYVHGKPAGSVPETGDGSFPFRTLLQIGYDNMGGSYFQGALHRFALHNRALSPEEVARLAP